MSPAPTHRPQWTACANVYGDRVFRDGAKVLLRWHSGDAISVNACGLSKGGRRVTKWVRIKRLRNIRAAFVGHPAMREAFGIWDTKEAAAPFVDHLKGCADEAGDNPTASLP